MTNTQLAGFRALADVLAGVEPGAYTLEVWKAQENRWAVAMFDLSLERAAAYTFYFPTCRITHPTKGVIYEQTPETLRGPLFYTPAPKPAATPAAPAPRARSRFGKGGNSPLERSRRATRQAERRLRCDCGAFRDINGRCRACENGR